MKVVIAIGESALGRGAGARDDLEGRVRAAAESIARVARHHDVVVTHGNPPLAALRTGEPTAGMAAGLDLEGALREGALGYLLEQELENALPTRDVAALITQVEVDAKDPAFARPSAAVGPVVDAETAERWRSSHGWTVGPVEGGFRRLVPAPTPRHVRELRTVRLLLSLGVVVVCGGGGGIPVVRGVRGILHGVEARVDPDQAAVVLATDLGADRLLLLTDVAAVLTSWPDASGRAVRSGSPRALRELALDPATMGAKVEAASLFAKQCGRPAAIGPLDAALELLEGSAGTQVLPGAAPVELA